MLMEVIMLTLKMSPEVRQVSAKHGMSLMLRSGHSKQQMAVILSIQ